METLEKVQGFVQSILTAGALLESFDALQGEQARITVELARLSRSGKGGMSDSERKVSVDVLLDTKKLLDKDAEGIQEISNEMFNVSILELRRVYQEARSYLSLYEEFYNDLAKLKAAYNIIKDADAFSDDPQDEDSQEYFEATIGTIEARFNVVVSQMLSMADHWA